MSEQTKVDVQRLQDIAASIGALLDDHPGPFEELYGYRPEFGDFEAARWLGDLVTDRRDAVLAHVAYLRRSLTEIQEALGHIAGDVSDTDAVNGAAVRRAGDR